MPESSAVGEAVLEVISPDNSRQHVRVTHLPFFIGRGEVGNHLHLADRRISRKCAAIVLEGGRYHLEDCGHHLGVYVNREKFSKKALEEGDQFSFGLENSYQIIFHTAAAPQPQRQQDAGIEVLLTRIGQVAASEPSATGLDKLNLLLEATMLLHSDLPLDAVLEAMLDRAVAVTNADRALLLEADAAGTLRQRLARRAGNVSMPAEGFSPTQTAVRQAIEKNTGVITEDLRNADISLQGAESIIAQNLRAVVAIPLYSKAQAKSVESTVFVRRGQLLGVLYLDSRRPAAFSKLDRQILDALAVEAASILDNARLVEQERHRKRLEQELGIARQIQQALLPRGFRDFPYVTFSGINTPCHAVGGDYFDVFPMGEDRTAFVIADVAGKGLGAALVSTMLQGALTGMTPDTDPTQVFERINAFLCAHSEVGRFATVLFCILDKEGRLDYLSAGHPSPLILRRGEVKELFSGGSLPVGLFPDAAFSTSAETLEPGDTLVLFSDGVTEAMDPDGQLFGTGRLSKILGDLHDAPLDRIEQAVMTSVTKFADTADQADDLTLLLARYRGSGDTAGSEA